MNARAWTVTDTPKSGSVESIALASLHHVGVEPVAVRWVLAIEAVTVSASTIVAARHPEMMTTVAAIDLLDRVGLSLGRAFDDDGGVT